MASRGTSFTAAFVCARAELRARRGSMLALAILLGLASGAVMTTAAGARRTNSAYGRFAKAYKAADMLIYPAYTFDSSFAKLDFDQVSVLPQVAVAGRQLFLGATDENLEVIGDGTNLGTRINRYKMLEGRMPRADSRNEAAVSFLTAESHHLHVGSPYPITFGRVDGQKIPMTFRVVGIEASPGEFPPNLSNTGPGQGGQVHVPLALALDLRRKNVFSFDFLLLRFKHGAADYPAVNNELNQLARGKPQLNLNLAAQADNVQRSIHLQAVALWIVGALLALIGVLVLSQLISRQATIDADENPTLLALGMTRTEIAVAGLIRSAILGTAGAVFGVVVAVAVSPLMPIGTARIAEPHTGVSLDLVVLGIGAIAAVVAVVVMAAPALWRSTKSAPVIESVNRPSFIARSAIMPGFPPSVGTGVRLALERGSGRTAVPVRSSLTSVSLAIVALTGALTFGAGLNHMLGSPRQYGWNWDVHMSSSQDIPNADPLLKAIDADPDIQAASLIDSPPVQFGRSRFDAMALLQHRGTISPIVLQGRAPISPNEVAFGVRTLHELHAHIGSTVHGTITAIEGGGADFKVVGTVVIPPNSDTARLGSGGVFSYTGVYRMVPAGFKGLPPVTDALIKFAPGVDKRAKIADLRKRFADTYDIILPQKPSDLVNFGKVQNLPLLLAALLAVLAAATLGHTLITAIRRRRRDLAILKLLGFVPRQVRSAVAWQATTFVTTALVIGLPIGIVIGRIVWAAFERSIGTVVEPVTPWVPIALIIPAAIVLSNVIAAVPAAIAGRMKPAPALRAE